MPLIRKRRSAPQAEPDEEEASSSEAELVPGNSRRRRRVMEEESSSAEPSEEDNAVTRAPSSTDVMVKKLVRLALASEYSRQAIRRADISAKVLGEQGSRKFKPVFEAAQNALRTRFGMEMVELPMREKVTVSQRRAAQKVEKQSTGNKTWILTTVLPAEYRALAILPPTKAPSSSTDSTYTALYTFIIALILLNGGSLSEQKLERYLKRTNIDTYTPIDRTDRLFTRLCKEGYLVKNRDMDTGEEVLEYMVGPRGKVEVGEKGVSGLVRQVFGRQAAVEDPNDLTPAERDQMEEFERRLQRSLGFKSRPVDADDEGAEDVGTHEADENGGQDTR